MLKELLEVFYPQDLECPLCGNPLRKGLICKGCEQQALAFSKLSFCLRCGRLLGDEGFCGECEDLELPFVAARAVGPYEGLLKEALYRLKYTGMRSLAPVLAFLMVEVVLDDRRFSKLLRETDPLIVPVPLAAEKEKKRGFNQSALLADELGKLLKLPVDDKALVKIRNTVPQAKLVKEERKHNLEGAFILQKKADVNGRPILLIDDIFTTGTTIMKCCEALKGGDAGDIYVLSAATGQFSSLNSA